MHLILSEVAKNELKQDEEYLFLVGTKDRDHWVVGKVGEYRGLITIDWGSGRSVLDYVKRAFKLEI